MGSGHTGMLAGELLDFNQYINDLAERHCINLYDDNVGPVTTGSQGYVMDSVADPFEYVFDAEPCDIDFLDLIKRHAAPVVDLRPLCRMLQQDEISVEPSVVLAPLLTLDAELRDRFIFVGERSAIVALLAHEPDVKHVLLSNRSIAEMLK